MIFFFAIFVSLCAIGLGEEPANVEQFSKQTCARNEKWKDCYCADNSCYNPYGQIYCIRCLPGCYCKNGYVRNDDNQCVLIRDCPYTKQCPGKNELFQSCHPSCDPTCSDQNPQCAGCYFDCFCKPGFVRNYNGECILPSQCPKPEVCKENEFWDECGCVDPTCENPKLVANCYACQRGCFCKKGYVRNANNECILAGECPNNYKN